MVLGKNRKGVFERIISNFICLKGMRFVNGAFNTGFGVGTGLFKLLKGICVFINCA
jgi:hypothetical protein